MGKCIASAFFVVGLAACHAQTNPPAPREPPASAARAHLPPPPPPSPSPPVFSTAVARRRAVAMGVGDCSDLARIREYPFRPTESADPYYDRIYYQVPAYRACLVDSLGDFSPITALHLGPGIEVRSRAALAFSLLTDAGVIGWDVCKPASLRKQERAVGAAAFFAWLETPANQESWTKCVHRALAPNNSSKPTPLRGAA